MRCEAHFNVTVQSEYSAKVFRYAKVLANQQAPDEDKKNIRRAKRVVEGQTEGFGKRSDRNGTGCSLARSRFAG